MSGQDQDHFDLQPMIALMMCLLGALLLVTMVMACLNVGAGAAEGWIPDKDRSDGAKTPKLVEWDGSCLTVHEGAGRRTIALGSKIDDWLDDDGGFRNPDFRAFLAEMQAKRATDYVLLAVRPSGFKTFQGVAQCCRIKKIDVGYEPIEQGKPVRLRRAEGVAP